MLQEKSLLRLFRSVSVAVTSVSYTHLDVYKRQSYVRKGMVTEVSKDLVENQGKQYDVCVAIGPMIMMKFVCKLTKELNIPTIVSMHTNFIMIIGPMATRCV